MRLGSLCLRGSSIITIWKTRVISYSRTWTIPAAWISRSWSVGDSLRVHTRIGIEGLWIPGSLSRKLLRSLSGKLLRCLYRSLDDFARFLIISRLGVSLAVGKRTRSSVGQAIVVPTGRIQAVLHVNLDQFCNQKRTIILRDP